MYLVDLKTRDIFKQLSNLGFEVERRGITDYLLGTKAFLENEHIPELVGMYVYQGGGICYSPDFGYLYCKIFDNSKDQTRLLYNGISKEYAEIMGFYYERDKDGICAKLTLKESTAELVRQASVKNFYLLEDGLVYHEEKLSSEFINDVPFIECFAGSRQIFNNNGFDNRVLPDLIESCIKGKIDDREIFLQKSMVEKIESLGFSLKDLGENINVY